VTARPRLVLDASAALHAAMGLGQANRIFDLIEESAIVLAPALYCAEVANGLYKYVKADLMTEVQALDLHDRAVNLVDQLIGETELAREALAASIRFGHPVYDGFYAVLARRNGCPVLTLDRRLASLLERMQVDSITPEGAG
jgi:predicted nucleic acid-binding protein